jgi:general secretion pathway protein J
MVKAMRGKGIAQCGFTLLEVLIAVSILGIMLALLFGTFAICSRSWKMGDDYIRQVEQMAMVQNFFRTHLSDAWNEPGLMNTDDMQDPDAFNEWAFFQGREQYLQFVSLMPESAARRGWYLFKIGIKPNSTSLYVSMLPFLPFKQQDRPVSDDLEILSDIDTFMIYYWGKKPDDEKPKWHHDWINLPYLPEMVSINIKLRNQRPWTTLVVAPRRALPQRSPVQANAQ